MYICQHCGGAKTSDGEAIGWGGHFCGCQHPSPMNKSNTSMNEPIGILDGSGPKAPFLLSELVDQWNKYLETQPEGYWVDETFNTDMGPMNGRARKYDLADFMKWLSTQKD